MALQEQEVDEATGAEAEEGEVIVKIPVPKAGKGVYVEFSLNDVHDRSYKMAVIAGLKQFVNRKMTKITTSGLEGKDLEAAQAKAYEQALENLDDIKQGKVRDTVGGGGKKAGTGKIMTEAMRIARQLVKDAMKRDKIRLSDVDAKEITAAAKDLIEENPGILKEAEENLQEREKKEKKIVVKTSKIRLNPEKVAANNAKKRTKAPVEAGKVRQRGEARQ
jgi:hypothetical protein